MKITYTFLAQNICLWLYPKCLAVVSLVRNDILCAEPWSPSIFSNLFSWDEAIWGTDWYILYLPVCNHDINKAGTFQSRYWRLTLAVYIPRPVSSVTVLMKICHHVFMQFTPHKSTWTEKIFLGTLKQGIMQIPWTFFYKHQLKICFQFTNTFYTSSIYQK